MIVDLLLVLLLAAVFVLLLYLLQKVRDIGSDLTQFKQQFEGILQSEVRGLFAQLAAYVSLRDRLDLRRGMPYSRDWSASPDFLEIIVAHCLDAKPATVMECSAGITTLMLAKCCQLNGRGKVYSLEDGEEFARKARAHLDRYELGAHASVIHAPLQSNTVNGIDYLWYSVDKLPDQTIDMLVIDGPSGFIQKNSRYPAIPELYEKLSDQCVVFLDDAARVDEKEIVELWKAEYPSMEYEYIRTERGCSVLTINK
jgi:predicted O-methyltransferase YrrM